MGLDMHLRKKTYIGANYDFNNITGTLALKKDNKPIPLNLSKITYILEEQAYWLKANQIHRWFVDNVQHGVDDCGIYEVYGEQLLKLVELCKRVLTDHSLADSLLPSRDGFYFGSTKYNEFYFKDLESTVEQLKDVEPDTWYEYTSSW